MTTEHPRRSAEPQRPSVSVIIPTLLRPSLVAAIGSVLDQDYRGRIELIVVVDRDESDCTPVAQELTAGADAVYFTGGAKFGGGARNIGVSHASGELVAFLDDDDSWRPEKIERQVATYEGHSDAKADAVVSCRFVEVLEGGADQSSTAPARLIAPGERVEDYLFRSRRPSADRPSLLTSSLLTSRSLATDVAWSTTLRRHQDWDWLMRLQESGRARFVHDEGSLVIYTVGSNGSISSSSDWRASLEWADLWRSTWSRRTYVDFVAGQPVRYALQSRSLRGVLASLRAIVAGRALPAPGPIIIGLAGIMPRRLFDRLLVRGSGRRASTNDRPTQDISMLISHVAPTMGMERCALRLAEAHEDIGIVCIGEDRAAADRLAEGSEVLGTPLRGWRRLASVLRLRRWSRSHRGPVLAVGVWAAVPLLLARRRLGFPVVVWEHSLSAENVRSSRGLRLLAGRTRRAYSKADLVVCVSEELAHEVSRRVPRSRVVVIPNYIPAVQAHDLTPRQQHSDVRLLTVGALSAIKNHRLLLAAMAELPDEYSLVVAGDGDLRRQLEQLAESLGISDRIDWRGHVGSMPELYRECDLVVQPALGETFGMVMFEAASFRVPVVAVDYPHARSVVPRLVPGRLAEPTPVAFAAAIRDTARTAWTDEVFLAAEAARAAELSDDVIDAQWRAIFAGLEAR